MDARTYYDLTEDSYRALCPFQSGHMNMGLWPESSLSAAQDALVESVIKFHKALSKTKPNAVIDGGSGWGGSRRFFFNQFPSSSYHGINVSQRQITVASEANIRIPNTTYHLMDIRDIHALESLRADAFFSIEAAFHFEKKEDLIKSLRQMAVRSVTIADICVEKPEDIARVPLVLPALRNGWSTKDYELAFRNTGYTLLGSENVSSQVFNGWSDHLFQIDDKKYAGRKRLLEQFRLGFRQMAELADQHALSYRWFHAEVL